MVYVFSRGSWTQEALLIYFKFYVRSSRRNSVFGDSVWRDFLSMVNCTWTYYIMIATSIIVLFLIWMLKEPSVKLEKADSVTMKQIYLDR